MLHKIMICGCTNRLGDVAPLILRIALGVIFAWHGYDKVFVKGIPAITGFFTSIGIPLPGLMSYVVGYGELGFGILLILGLLTHWASKFAVIVAIVAFLTVHMSKGFAVGGGGYEFIMLIGAAAFSLMITGAGKYSLDSMWLKRDTHSM